MEFVEGETLENLIKRSGQLERNDLVKIVDLEVAKVIERVRAKDIKVQMDRSAVQFRLRSNLPRSTDAPRRREIPRGSTGRGVLAREVGLLPD
jgi:hypothetical protein